MEQYLINYLRENSTDLLVKKYVEFFKIELDWFIYNYGENISPNHSIKIKNKKKTLYSNIQYFSSILCKVKTNDKINILSGVPFTNKKILSNMGFNPISSVYQPIGYKQILGDKESISLLKRKSKIILKGSFNDMLNRAFFHDFEELQSKIINLYKTYDLRALLLYTDEYFESKYLLDIFKKLNRPSFIFSHGLPGIYTLEVDNKSDYLMVWGEQIKQNYINAGFDSKKIIVSGCPFFPNIKKSNFLRNTLDNILVIPCSSSLWHQHGWGTPELIDRSMSILYLYQVQKVLEYFGVTHARFRPHPSTNSHWTYGFLDHDFYEIDKDNLEKSLSISTLVIGATSTVFLQAILNGVNYLVYEPNKNKVTARRSKLVPPFDGSDEMLQIASNEDELIYLIKNKYLVNVEILDKYLSPLNLEGLKRLII